MTKCRQCGNDVPLAYRCRRCGGLFCDEHRLPENHSCDAIALRREQEIVAEARSSTSTVTQLENWVRTGSPGMIYVEGHRFEFTKLGEVLIDQGKFQKDEAYSVGRMLISRNPFSRFTAELVIWGRNGRLLMVVLMVAMLLLAIVLIRVRR